MTVPVYLSNPYQKTGFVVLCKRITSTLLAGYLNKVVLLLPQCTNIAWEQMVVEHGEPPVLKMPYFFTRGGF